MKVVYFVALVTFVMSTRITFSEWVPTRQIKQEKRESAAISFSRSNKKVSNERITVGKYLKVSCINEQCIMNNKSHFLKSWEKVVSTAQEKTFHMFKYLQNETIPSAVLAKDPEFGNKVIGIFLTPMNSMMEEQSKKQLVVHKLEDLYEKDMGVIPESNQSMNTLKEPKQRIGKIQGSNQPVHAIQDSNPNLHAIQPILSNCSALRFYPQAIQTCITSYNFVYQQCAAESFTGFFKFTPGFCHTRKTLSHCDFIADEDIRKWCPRKILFTMELITEELCREERKPNSYLNCFKPPETHTCFENALQNISMNQSEERMALNDTNNNTKSKGARMPSHHLVNDSICDIISSFINGSIHTDYCRQVDIAIECGEASNNTCGFENVMLQIYKKLCVRRYSMSVGCILSIHPILTALVVFYYIFFFC